MVALWSGLLRNVGLHIDDNIIKTSQRIEIWTANGLYGGRHLGCGVSGLFGLAARRRTFRHRYSPSLCTSWLFILGPVWTFHCIQSPKAPQYTITPSTTDIPSLKTLLNQCHTKLAGVVFLKYFYTKSAVQRYYLIKAENFQVL